MLVQTRNKHVFLICFLSCKCTSLHPAAGAHNYLHTKYHTVRKKIRVPNHINTVGIVKTTLQLFSGSKVISRIKYTIIPTDRDPSTLSKEKPLTGLIVYRIAPTICLPCELIISSFYLPLGRGFPFRVTATNEMVSPS